MEKPAREGPDRASPLHVDPAPADSVESSYESIRRLIREGRFAGGQPLRSAQIAAQIGVSRSPVRDALARLAAEGIVELLPNRGARLIGLGTQDVHEIFDLRAMLEPHGAARAAVAATKEDIAELSRLAEEVERAESTSDRGLLNDEFHMKIARMSGNEVLVEVLPAVIKEPLLHASLTGTAVDRAVSQQQHYEVVDAIRARNPAWAEAAMRAHIEFARRLYLSHEPAHRD